MSEAGFGLEIRVSPGLRCSERCSALRSPAYGYPQSRCCGRVPTLEAEMKVHERMETSVTPVAVIGMGCRLPGGIDSPDKLWEALLRGDDLVTEIPPDRWDADSYYDPEPGVPGRSVSRWGAFLDDVAGFDAEFFGISEREATA